MRIWRCAISKIQPFIREALIAVIGWSHGGTVVLRAINHNGHQAAKRPAPGFRAAIAFYPKCFGNESFRIPFLMQMGAEDYGPRPRRASP